MTVPTLDMTGWTVLDFELALAGLQRVADATLWLQNQPRSERAEGGYHPGADFIVALGEDWCGNCIDQIIDHLSSMRFDDPRDDERRVLLLLADAASHSVAGDLPRIIQMALDQSVRPAA